MAGELRHRRVPPEDGDGDEGVAASFQRLDSASSSAADGNGKAGTLSGCGGGGGEGVEPQSGKRDALGWLEWGRGWMAVVGEFLFQRIAASHLANPLELPPLDGVSIVVTGATSGIGLEIARFTNAGHMVPMDQPKASLEMLRRFTQGKLKESLPETMVLKAAM